jgi:hypothetical protein
VLAAGGFEAGFEGSSSYEGSGQTREHAQLARSLGIEQLAVVVSKLDTVDYSQVGRALPGPATMSAARLSAAVDSMLHHQCKSASSSHPCC